MSKVTINYKVEGKEWKEALDKAFQKLNKKAKIDGFRPGKAPRNLFEQKYGVQELYTEASDDLIHKQFHKILDEQKLEIVAEPKVDLVKLSDNEMEVNYIFITAPVINLKKYKNLGVKKQETKVTKKEIDEEIKKTREKYAELVSKDGKIEDHNTAIIDFEGFLDGVAFEGGKGTNYSLEIGSNTFIPGFEEALIGLEKGEEKDLNLTFPNDYGSADLAGKEVIFKVKVNDIKEKVIPELNEDFYQDLGVEGVNSKETFAKMIEEEMIAKKNIENDNMFTDNLLKELIKNIDGEIDEEIYDSEVDRMYQQFIERMSMQGINEDLYFQYTNSTKEDLQKSMKEEAKYRVNSRYALNKVAELEKIDVTDDELESEIKEVSEKYQMEKTALLEAIGGSDAIKYDLKLKKAMEVIKENN